MPLLAFFLAATAPLPPELAEALQSPDQEQLPVYVALYETNELNASARIDPSQPEGKRVTVLSPKQEDWPKGFEKKLTSFEAGADGDIWCDTAEEMIGGPVKEHTRSESAITYHFPIAVTEESDKADRAFAKASHGEVDIAREGDTPWQVSSLRIHLDEPFKPAVVAKVTKLNIEISCTPASNGRMYQETTLTGVEGSAFGRAFNEREKVQLRNVTFPQGN